MIHRTENWGSAQRNDAMKWNEITYKGRHWRCPRKRKLSRHRRCPEKWRNEMKWKEKNAYSMTEQKTESPQAVPREMMRWTQNEVCNRVATCEASCGPEGLSLLIEVLTWRRLSSSSPSQVSINAWKFTFWMVTTPWGIKAIVRQRTPTSKGEHFPFELRKKRLQYISSLEQGHDNM